MPACERENRPSKGADTLFQESHSMHSPDLEDDIGELIDQVERSDLLSWLDVYKRQPLFFVLLFVFCLRTAFYRIQIYHVAVEFIKSRHINLLVCIIGFSLRALRLVIDGDARRWPLAHIATSKVVQFASQFFRKKSCDFVHDDFTSLNFDTKKEIAAAMIPISQ